MNPFTILDTFVNCISQLTIDLAVFGWLIVLALALFVVLGAGTALLQLVERLDCSGDGSPRKM